MQSSGYPPENGNGEQIVASLQEKMFSTQDKLRMYNLKKLLKKITAKLGNNPQTMSSSGKLTTERYGSPGSPMSATDLTHDDDVREK